MNTDSAIKLIKETFNNKFSEKQYRNFIINLLDKIDENEAFSQPLVGQYVPESFRGHIKAYNRIGKYTDSNGKIIEILWVHLKTLVSGKNQ